MMYYKLKEQNQMNADYMGKIMAASERDTQIIEFLRTIKRIEEINNNPLLKRYYLNLRSMIKRTVINIRKTLDSTIDLSIKH